MERPIVCLLCVNSTSKPTSNQNLFHLLYCLVVVNLHFVAQLWKDFHGIGCVYVRTISLIHALKTKQVLIMGKKQHVEKCHSNNHEEFCTVPWLLKLLNFPGFSFFLSFTHSHALANACKLTSPVVLKPFPSLWNPCGRGSAFNDHVGWLWTCKRHQHQRRHL